MKGSSKISERRCGEPFPARPLLTLLTNATRKSAEYRLMEMESATKDQVPQHPVVVFDGECSLCNGWIDFLLRFDKKDIFRFTSRQSETGAGFALQSGIPPGGAGSIIVVEDKRIRLRSDAVLRMLSLLGLPFSLLGIFRLIPAALRDVVYDLIARNRKRWFGQTTQCRIPAPSERHRFL